MQQRNPRPNPEDWANAATQLGVGVKPDSADSHPGVESDGTIIDFPHPPSDAVSADAEATLVDVDATLAEGISPPPSLARGRRRVEINVPLLETGEVLAGRYEILQLLGEGGMGAVYKAQDRELNRPVALKLIRPELAANPSIVARFKQELLLSQQVTHKNVIRIYDMGDSDGVKFITMEFVEGQDLRGLIVEKKKFSTDEAVEIVKQVCRALEAAHGVGVIHRDLKPQNIMRDKTGRILVMDFGMARTVEGDGMTQTGALVGTMEYMSPEQALGKDLDQRSDLFAVGLILYELLTGKMPFKAESALASLIKRNQERAIPVSDHDGTIPRPVSDIVSKCLERDPGQRYQSASEMLQDLDDWRGNRAAASLRFQPAVEPWGRTVHWPLLIGIATVLVLAIAGYVFRGTLFSSSGKQAASGPPLSLAILPFRNASGDHSLDWLGTTVAEMLRTDIGQSAVLRTVPSDRVNQILHDLRVAPDAALDPDTLRRVTEFSSADRVVSGQYLRLGEQIRIDATLQDLKRQRNFALKAEAASEKDLPKALEQLAESVEKNLALPTETIKDLQAKSLKPSTESVQALRYYNEGVQLTRQGQNLSAVKQLEAAIKEDPNFALAYSKLGGTYAGLGYGDKAQEFSRKAVDLSDKVSPQEKYVILAEDARVAKNNPKAIESYENLAKILPDDPDVQYALARVYEDSGSFDKARALYQKLLATDPKNSDALLRLGWVEIKDNNSQGSLDYLNRALTLTVQLGNDEEKALILDAIGNAYQHLNKQDDALRNYQQALDIKRRLENKGGIAETLNLTAQSQEAAGSSNLALKNYEEAVRLRREVGDKLGLGRSLLDIGGLHESLGHYDEALSLTKEALPLLRDMGDRQNEAMCLNNIGWFYLDKADYENAMTYLQQGLQLRQQVGSPADIADSFYNIGETYGRMGQYDHGTDYYLKALDLWRKAGDKRGVAFASYGLSRIFQYQGRYGAALTSAKDALTSWREVNEGGFWVPEIQGNYGNALSLVARWDEAQKNLDEALAAARELKNQPLIAKVLEFQGDRLFYRGDFKGARTLFEQAAQAATRTTDREQILLSKLNLAKVAVKEGRLQEAMRVLKPVAEEADRTGLKYLSVECNLYMAEALTQSKDYGRARQQLEDSLRASQKLGLQTLVAETDYQLAETLRLSGSQAEASHHYAEAHRILDDIRKEAGSDDVLKRSDLATIYQESARWQAPGI